MRNFLTPKVVIGVLAALVGVALCTAVVLLNRPQEVEHAFLEPAGIMCSADGTLYVADRGTNAILRMKDNKAYLVAGRSVQAGDGRAVGSYADGPSRESFFNGPSALAEWLGGVAVSDTQNNRIRLIRGNRVMTLAGSGEQGCRNGTANEASFYAPRGIAVGDDGNLYVADSENGCIRMIHSDGQVETVLSGLDLPVGLCWMENVLYIADSGANLIYRWTDNVLEVAAGTGEPGQEERNAGFLDGPAAEARFCAPTALAVMGGCLYIADAGNSAIRKLENGSVTTVKAFEGTGGDLWPAKPMGLAVKDGVLYAADVFAGVIYPVE